MANDRLIFEVVAEGKNLKVVQRDVNALAEGVERTDRARKNAGKGQDNYNKREKALYQGNLSSAKSFSKMNQTIGSGSSGLVGAYATLAANVFAATAAFNTLRDAAQFEQVVAGLEAVGAAAGRNLTFAAQKLQEVSGHALSADASMRVMALGVSSGFSTTQMEKLTVVAKGASAALGRNLTDALDRLTRGTAKLEPEILDELGIMVRLDDATRDYAAQLGKTADELTEFERKQAFLNATLEQGEKKFGALAETLDPNPYDQLAASMSNLLKTFLQGANQVLVPMINLLSGSMTAMAGAALLFGSTISRQVLPFLYGAAGAAKETALSLAGTSREFAIAKLGALSTGGALAKYGQALATGTEDEKKLASAIKGSNRQIKNREAIIAEGTDAQGNMNKAARTAKKELNELNAARKSLTDMEAESARTRHATSKANALEAVSRGKLITGFKELNTEISSYHTNNANSLKSSSTAAKGLNGLRTAGYAAGTALRFVGTGFLAMLGPIGLILSLGAMVIPMLTDMFKKPKTELEKVQEEIEEAFSNISDISDSVMTSLDRFGSETAEGMTAGFRAMQGVMQETSDALLNLQEAFDNMNAASRRESKSRQNRLQILIETLEDRISDQQAKLDATGTGTRKGRKDAAAHQAVKKDNERRLQEARDLMENELKIFKVLEEKKGKLAKEELKKVLLDRRQQIIDSPMHSMGIGRNQVREFAQIYRDIENDRIVDATQLEAAMANAMGPLNTIVNATDTATSNSSKLFQELNKIGDAESSRYSKGIELLQKQTDAAEDYNKAIRTELPGLAGKERRKALMDEQLLRSGFVKLLGEQEGKNLGIVKEYVAETANINKEYIEGKQRLKTLQNETKTLGKLAKKAGTPEAVLAHLEKEDELREAKLAQIQREITLEKRLGASDLIALEKAYELNKTEKNKEAFLKRREEFLIKIGALTQQQIALEEEAQNEEVRKAAVLVAQEATLKKLAATESKLISLSKQRLSNLQQIHQANLVIQKAQSGRGLTMGLEDTAGDSLRTFYKFATERRRLARMEYTLSVARFQLEHDLLIAKNFLLKKQLEADRLYAEGTEQTAIDAIVKSLDAYPEKLGLVLEAQKATAKTLLDAQLKSLDAEKEKLQLANLRSLLGEGAGTGDVFGKGGKGIKNFSTNLIKSLDAADAKAQQNYLKKRTKFWMDANIGVDATGAAEIAEQELQTELKANAFSVDANLTGIDKITAALAPMSVMFQQLAEMGGPDANLMGALGENMQMFPAMFSELEDNEGFANLRALFSEEGTGGLGETIQGIASGIALVAGALTAVYKVKAAQTADRISAIDKEIALVKKLGGTTESKEKKIMALEKKKEALKRKQFEDNKKMMLAQAIMATALGIAQAVGMVDLFPFNFVLAGIVAAMGAMQIAIISGMTYQGGGGSSAPSKPTAVSMGERKNKVDVSRNNVAGELAYMRGERGQGSGASNFTPAFTGYRHRATGGAAYVVGEQGPELFVPEVPGQIVPNDEMGGAAANITANFNIQTIDATTMEETLTTQRGNIINMIREAANNSGEQFLESVDTLGLQTEEGVV